MSSPLANSTDNLKMNQFDNTTAGTASAGGPANDPSQLSGFRSNMNIGNLNSSLTNSMMNLSLSNGLHSMANYKIKLRNLPHDISVREAYSVFALANDLISVDVVHENINLLQSINEPSSATSSSNDFASQQEPAHLQAQQQQPHFAPVIVASFKSAMSAQTIASVLNHKQIFGPNTNGVIAELDDLLALSNAGNSMVPSPSLNPSMSNIGLPQPGPANNSDINFNKRPSVVMQKSRFMFSDPFNVPTNSSGSPIISSALPQSQPPPLPQQQVQQQQGPPPPQQQQQQPPYVSQPQQQQQQQQHQSSQQQQPTPPQATAIAGPSASSPSALQQQQQQQAEMMAGKSLLMMEAQNDAMEYEQLVRWGGQPQLQGGAQQQAQAQAHQYPPQSQQAPSQPDWDRRRTSSFFVPPPNAQQQQAPQPIPAPAPGPQAAQQQQQQRPPLVHQGSGVQSALPQSGSGGLPTASSSSQQQQQSASAIADIPELSLLARVPAPVNPADQNPPCNTLYVGNLPPDASEAELRALFAPQQGFRRLSFRTKANTNGGGSGSGSGSGHNHGPMCFVEFEDVSLATRALAELYGKALPNRSLNGGKGIRLSFSKNPLGVRGPARNPNGGSNIQQQSQQQQQQQQQQQAPPQHNGANGNGSVMNGGPGGPGINGNGSMMVQNQGNPNGQNQGNKGNNPRYSFAY